MSKDDISIILFRLGHIEDQLEKMNKRLEARIEQLNKNTTEIVEGRAVVTALGDRTEITEDHVQSVDKRLRQQEQSLSGVRSTIAERAVPGAAAGGVAAMIVELIKYIVDLGIA